MADLRVVENEKRQLPAQEQLARLVYEMQRSALVWNFFAGVIIDGWYPGRNKTMGGQFNGSDRERLEQLFKIRDHETRHMLDVLRELGIEETNLDYAAIYDQLSAATSITAMSHKSI